MDEDTLFLNHYPLYKIIANAEAFSNHSNLSGVLLETVLRVIHSVKQF